jgi:hypothetical protein
MDAGYVVVQYWPYLVRVSNGMYIATIFNVDSSCAANRIEINSVSTVNYGVINLF